VFNQQVGSTFTRNYPWLGNQVKKGVSFEGLHFDLQTMLNFGPIDWAQKYTSTVQFCWDGRIFLKMDLRQRSRGAACQSIDAI
jgi:hypothetical protein